MTTIFEEHTSAGDGGDGGGVGTVPAVRGFWGLGAPLAQLSGLTNVDADGYATAVMSVINQVMDEVDAHPELIAQIENFPPGMA